MDECLPMNQNAKMVGRGTAVVCYPLFRLHCDVCRLICNKVCWSSEDQ